FHDTFCDPCELTLLIAGSQYATLETLELEQGSSGSNNVKIPFLPRLKELSILHLEDELEPFTFLEKLPALETLKIKSCKARLFDPAIIQQPHMNLNTLDLEFMPLTYGLLNDLRETFPAVTNLSLHSPSSDDCLEPIWKWTSLKVLRLHIRTESY